MTLVWPCKGVYRDKDYLLSIGGNEGVCTVNLEYDGTYSMPYICGSERTHNSPITGWDILRLSWNVELNINQGLKILKS